MITLKRLNEVRQVASEERAAKLEKEGYIQRLPSDQDRRSKHLYVTDKGLALRNQKIDAEVFYFSWLTAELTEEELAVLVPLLDRLHTRSRNERLEEFVNILGEYNRTHPKKAE